MKCTEQSRAVYVLVGLTLLLLGVDLFVYLHDFSVELRTSVSQAFSGFNGALLLALTTQTKAKPEDHVDPPQEPENTSQK